MKWGGAAGTVIGLAVIAAWLFAGPAQAQTPPSQQGPIVQMIPGPGIVLTTGGGAGPYIEAIREEVLLLAVGAVLVATGAGAQLGAALMVGGVASMTMSCPVFVGDGTLLGEDSCVWTNVTGQQTTQFSSTTDSAAWRAGGQKEIGPGWFLGGALGVGGSSSQTSAGPTGRGRTFDGGVAVKHVTGPLLLAAGLSAATSWNHTDRFVGLPGGGVGVMQSDANLFQGGLRLRGAYDVVGQGAFQGWYLRPRFDFDVIYTRLAGFQEYGPSPVAMSINGTDRAGVIMTPTLEIGGRVNPGGTTILRPYLSAGVSFLPNNNWTLNGSLGSNTLSAAFTGPEVIGNLEAGLQLYEAKGWEVKLDYKLSAAAVNFLSQSLGLRGAWHF